MSDTAKREYLIDVRELAKELDVTTEWVGRSARAGQIPSIKVGKYRKYRLKKVRAALGDADDD